MDKRGERTCSRTLMQGGQERRSMWQQRCSICCCDVAAAVAPQQATASGSGGAFAAGVAISEHRHQVLVGLLQQVLPAASNRFNKSAVVTATAMLLTTCIHQKQQFQYDDDNQSVGRGNGQKCGSLATVLRHVVFLHHLLRWHCRICCIASSYGIIQ